jgi:hypothetical protein
MSTTKLLYIGFAGLTAITAGVVLYKNRKSIRNALTKWLLKRELRKADMPEENIEFAMKEIDRRLDMTVDEQIAENQKLVDMFQQYETAFDDLNQNKSESFEDHLIGVNIEESYREQLQDDQDWQNWQVNQLKDVTFSCEKRNLPVKVQVEYAPIVLGAVYVPAIATMVINPEFPKVLGWIAANEYCNLIQFGKCEDHFQAISMYADLWVSEMFGKTNQMTAKKRRFAQMLLNKMFYNLVQICGSDIC